MHPLLRPTNVVIAVLGAAVVGLGTVVAVDHTTTPAPRTQTASLAAAPTHRLIAPLLGRIRRIRAGQDGGLARLRLFHGGHQAHLAAGRR